MIKGNVSDTKININSIACPGMAAYLYTHTHTQPTDATASLIMRVCKGTLAPASSVALKLILEHNLA